MKLNVDCDITLGSSTNFGVCMEVYYKISCQDARIT